MADFATRLKELRKKSNLRQVDLAREMGVAQTTIANYEQHSRFPDEDTLRKIANYFEVSLDHLLGRSNLNILDENISELKRHEAPARDVLSPLARRYADLLLRGDREEAYDAVLQVVRKGTPVRTIYSEVFEPSLREVGRLWEINEIDVAREHYFSEATESLMALLYPHIKRPPARSGVVISVAVSGEFHRIGIKMISDILEEEGWKCYYIGVNTPTADLVRAIDEMEADVLAISATMEFNIDSVSNIIMHVRSVTGRKNLKIVTGGRAFNLDLSLWKRVGADGFGANLHDTISLLKSFSGSSYRAI